MAGAVMGSGTRRRGRSGRRRGKSAAMSEINITPMVDVMLVLLIIFMVAAPLLTVGVPVELPKTAAAALPTAQEEPLTVTMTADGQVMLMTEPVTLADLVPRLRAIAAERSDDRLFLRADGGISYARVMEVMGALNAGGFRNIGLVTDSGGGSSSAPAGGGDGGQDG